jgi:hypothetical protein
VATYPSLQASPPESSDIIINVFVFSSLTLALICAFVGILRKDQLKQHLLWTTKRTDARSQVLDRQSRFETNSSRRLWDSANHISLGLVFSIGLFATSIFVLLGTLHWFVALAVLLLASFALGVIFWRDLPCYYRQCRTWLRLIQLRLFRALPRSLTPPIIRRKVIPELSAGLGLSEYAMAGLLSRAILSRTSGLTASGVVEPGVWQHRVRGLLGLIRLSNQIHDASREVAAAQIAMLERIVDLVLAVLRDRNPLKGNVSMLSLIWSKAKGCLAWERSGQQSRDHVEQSLGPLSWLGWICDALRQFNTEEICLLSDVVSDQLAHTLRVTKAMQRGVSGEEGIPEESLFAAFCLAREMLCGVPPGTSELKLRHAIALAGVRLQFDLPPVLGEDTFIAELYQLGPELQGGRFSGCDNPHLLQHIAPRMQILRLNLRSLFQGDFRNLWHTGDREYYFHAVCIRSIR